MTHVDLAQLSDGHPLPWEELVPYEKEQGGYELLLDVTYSGRKFFVRVSPPRAG